MRIKYAVYFTHFIKTSDIHCYILETTEADRTSFSGIIYIIQ